MPKTPPPPGSAGALLLNHVGNWISCAPPVGRRDPQALALAIGVSRSHLYRWLSGERAPDPCSPSWLRLCGTLGLDRIARRELALACGLDPMIAPIVAAPETP